MVLIIKKFCSLITDNEQLFDLTSTPSAEFDTTQECIMQYHAKQNSYAAVLILLYKIDNSFGDLLEIIEQIANA